MLFRCSFHLTLHLSFSILYLAIAQPTTVHINHAHKGRAYGSHNSVEVAHRIAVDSNGFLYIAGNTSPLNADHDPWGDVDAGEVTGKTDTFIAKLTPSGILLWVRRTGSTEDDHLGDLKVVDEGIYFCGSTAGSFGRSVNGSADVFIMKMSSEGEWIWRRPFILGSRGHDICHSMTVDGAVYAVGSTSDTMFGDAVPINGSVHQFIARLEEREGLQEGLKLIKGRQRVGFGSSSAVAVGTTADSVYFMSLDWDTAGGSEERVTTYLNIADKDALILHRLQVLKPDGADSFRGVAMDVVYNSGVVFIVGVSTFEDGREGYYIMKYSPEVQDNVGGIAWSKFLGYRSPEVPLNQQRLGVAVDPAAGRLFVTGVEDGLYEDGEYGGAVLVPVFILDTQEGLIIEQWNRWTDIGREQQEITDVAVNIDGTGLLTGAWSTGPESYSKAWIATLGSRSLVSQKEGQEATMFGAVSERQEESTDGSSKATSIILFSIVGGIMGLSLLVFVVLLLKYVVDRIRERNGATQFSTQSITRRISTRFSRQPSQVASERDEAS